MRSTRIIPVLLIHDGGIYKTTKFDNPVYIGDPINTIRLFNDMEVDEIVILDIDASRNGRDPDLGLIEELASEAFMPFAYGGGITSLAQVRSLLQCGIEKVVLNHSAQRDLEIVETIASDAGSQSVVVSIDYQTGFFGKNKPFDYLSGKSYGTSVEAVACNVEAAGAGEILLNSVSRDGMMQGLDCELINSVADSVSVPVVACGGAGTLEHLGEAERAGASAIAAGSMFIFHGKQRGILVNYPTESELRIHVG